MNPLSMTRLLHPAVMFTLPAADHRLNIGGWSVEYCSLRSIKTTVKSFPIGRIRRIFVIIFSYFFAYRFTIDVLSHFRHRPFFLRRSRNRQGYDSKERRYPYNDHSDGSLGHSDCNPGISRLPQRQRWGACVSYILYRFRSIQLSFFQFQPLEYLSETH